MTRYGSSRRLQNGFGAGGHALVLGIGLLGPDDAHQLDLGELVLADHALGVLAGRAGLGAKARRPGGVAQRQRLGIEDLVGDQIGQRHLGGRDQPMAGGGAELVLGELRQLAGAEQHMVAHQSGTATSV